MAALILLRHGETDWNVKGRWQGQANASLNKNGRAQVERVAQELESYAIAAIYASDLRRTMETARIIGKDHGLRVVPERRLREINLGKWQGMLSQDIRKRNPRLFERWHRAPLETRPPGGESIPELTTRVLDALYEITARHPAELVVIVSHEMPLGVMICHLRGWDLARLRQVIPGVGEWQLIEATEQMGRVSGQERFKPPL